MKCYGYDYGCGYGCDYVFCYSFWIRNSHIGFEVNNGALTKGDETVVWAIKILKCECII